jgi:FHS family L-fucose permease-like MFS transporter
MSNDNNKGGNVFAIATMFALFFMIAFVTNFASPMGVIAKNQFNASNALSQLGNFANFFAYLFMGIPGGLILKRKGYKFTALLAVGVGIAGLVVQLTSGFVSSFAVYVTGAFIAGFSMCLLNLVVNPLLNTLGGGGNKGNQLVQFGCSLNSIGATLAPVLLGYLIGGEVAKAKVMDAAPERSKEALLAVEAGGRAAMAELRNVMGLLAAPDTGTGPQETPADGLEPQPGLDRLDALT